MKITIDLEMTPEEFRNVMGLPDLAPLQQEMIDQIREQMDAGMEGYDPLTLFKPYLPASPAATEMLQRLMLAMSGHYTGSSQNSES